MTTYRAEFKYILVVDDEEEIRTLIKGHLTESINNIKIVEAKDGSEAITKLSYQTFHCIITDLQMPKKDGVDLIEKIKSSNLNATTPIVVVTGFPDEQLLERFNNITFIEKPFDKKLLTQLVESQLKLGKMNQRVTADVLNEFIQSTYNLIKQLTKQEATVDAPLAKSTKDGLKGDLFALLEYKTSQVVSKICFGFDKNLAAFLIKSIKHNNVSTSSQPLDVFLSAVFKNVNSNLAKKKQSLSLSKIQFFNGSKDFIYKELSSLNAVVMPIKTQHGYIYVQAMQLDNTRK